VPLADEDHPRASVRSLTSKDTALIVYRDRRLVDKENLKHLRFVCMSDTHNQIDRIEIPDGDVFVHCGDAVNHRTSSTDIVRFNEFVGQLPHKYKLFVSGNHCVCLNANQPGRSQKLLSNMTYLQDQLIEIEGVKLYGSPWRPGRGCCYRSEAFGYNSMKIRADKWSNIPSNIDFLLTHGPPYSIRDGNAGCPDLLDEIVERVRPRVHLFGHQHNCHGASLYSSKNNQELELNKINPDTNDILFVNLAIHQRSRLSTPVIIDYYYD